ncbi:MAG TPA: MFS transporter [Bryobacteraceae bacterium]|nr:MFS transporter [Bryobacteraceae bacterium]
MPSARLRWLAVVVLVLSSALNYLDRMVLAALLPTIQTEFRLSREDVGTIFSAFSIVYALSSPLMGHLLDQWGLRRGTAIIVALWSTAGMITGLAGSFFALLACRAFLGLAESGGVPATGKGFAMYLPPEDRALGGALSQVGLTLGSMGAPLLTEWMSELYGWRSAFVVSGALGFVWIPFWLAIARRAPVLVEPEASKGSRVREMLRDRRYQAVVVANILAMTIYSLWTNWTTVFLVTSYGLTRQEANLRYAWIPPIFATLGGLLGGWLANRAIRAGSEVTRVRINISIGAAVFAFATALAPMAPAPAIAIAAVCVSLFATTCLSVNYYSLPLDLFGSVSAGFAVSLLTGVFGLMQAFLSPVIGGSSEKYGWQPVCLAISSLPLISALLLRYAFGRR